MSVKEAATEIETYLKGGDVDRAYHYIYNVPANLAVQILAYILFRLIVALTKAKVPSANNQPG